MLGAFVPLPDIAVTAHPETGMPVIGPKIQNGAPVMLAHITMDQATQLADAAYLMAQEYDLAKYFGGKTSALTVMGVTLITVYGPKFMTAKAIMQMNRAAQTPPPSAADFVNVAPAAQPSHTAGPTEGVYKYQ